eukprot:sb/3478853/
MPKSQGYFSPPCRKELFSQERSISLKNLPSRLQNPKRPLNIPNRSRDKSRDTKVCSVLALVGVGASSVIPILWSSLMIVRARPFLSLLMKTGAPMKN